MFFSARALNQNPKPFQTENLRNQQIDSSVRSGKYAFFVIPAGPVPDYDPGAGIQLYQMVPAVMASGFSRSDDFAQAVTCAMHKIALKDAKV